MIYYIDVVNGSELNSGLSETSPKKDYLSLQPQHGDSILFRCGSFYRSALETADGVLYGKWGDGDMPIFCGSVDASSPEDWERVADRTWKYTKDNIGKVGSIVFPDGYGTFCWESDDLRNQSDFWDSRQIDENKPQEYDGYKLLLYSEENPAKRYSHIEICHYGKRVLGYIKSGVTFDGIKFINSGVHGLAGQGKGVVIRNCVFENIGGVMFYKNKKVRFGNAVEFWQYAEDVLIENCSFRQVYDSCITHQGDRVAVKPAKNFICRNNTFDSYGMAAFEYRDRLPIDSEFTDNICKNAGCGFAMQGEELPRFSEIYPEPMGHHIFLWRIEGATNGGNLIIERNQFGNAPVGAAIYSRISPEAEAQMQLNNNVYEKNEALLIYFGGKHYTSLEEYKKETGKDINSTSI